MKTKKAKQTREAWLTHAVELLRPMFDEQGAANFPSLRVSCGFPKGGRKAIGQAWHAESSKDNSVELFISPTLDDPLRVLDVLMHELVHAIVGPGVGHRGPFRKLAKSLGLEGKMTATVASEVLKDKLAHLCGPLGKYPHAQLRPGMSTTKQTTRMLKLECDCGFICRATKTQIEDVGVPTCACGTELKLEA